MQTAAAIIEQMRRIAKVDTSQYPDEKALIDLNTLKDEFWSAIVSIKRKFNFEIWTSSSIELQSEYTLSEVAYNQAWTKQLSSVSINYNGETYENTWKIKYIQADRVNPYDLPYDWDYYVENQDEKKPLYYVADNSYFIAPAPLIAVTNWIKLTWIRKIPDYELTTTEQEMRIPVDQQKDLVFWLAVYWLMNKWVNDNIINNAEARWERKKATALYNLESRVEENPFLWEFPDDSLTYTNNLTPTLQNG